MGNAFVDDDGWVMIDGVKIGKLIMRDGEPCLQVKPKDRRRNMVDARLADLAKLDIKCVESPKTPAKEPVVRKRPEPRSKGPGPTETRPGRGGGDG